MKNLQNPKKCNVKLRLCKNQKVFGILPTSEWGFFFEVIYCLAFSRMVLGEVFLNVKVKRRLPPKIEGVK